MIGSSGAKNLIHVVLNNGSQEAASGFTTTTNSVSFKHLALGSGYTAYNLITRLDDLDGSWWDLNKAPGPHSVEIRSRVGRRPDLERPQDSARTNKLWLISKFTN